MVVYCCAYSGSLMQLSANIESILETTSKESADSIHIQFFKNKYQ